MVLRALKSPPCEPLQSTDHRPLMLKNALLLALTSVKHMGVLQALSVILKPRHGYIPKVLSTPFRAQVIITLSVLPPSEQDQELNLLELR